MANKSSIPTVKVEGSEELQRQIELLKYYPEIFDKHFYPAMQAAAEAVKDGIRPLIGGMARLEAGLGSKVRHSKSLGTSAHIGFGKRYGMPSARMAAPLNQGAKPHTVNGRGGGYLHFSSQGRHTITSQIEHPGLPAAHFMEDGLTAATPAINTRMAEAAEAVLTELSRP